MVANFQVGFGDLLEIIFVMILQSNSCVLIVLYFKKSFLANPWPAHAYRSRSSLQFSSLLGPLQ